MRNALYLFTLFAFFILTSCDRSTKIDEVEDEKYADQLPGTRPSDDNFLAKGWPDGQISAQAHERGLREAKLMALAEGDSPGFDLNWNTRGPANIGARINTVAIHPTNDSIMFVGFSRGGVWRTINGGQDWEPVFDEQLYLSIGDITFDPIDPNTIYVGTGDPNISSNFMIGDGVYRSTDGGDSWENIGWGELNIVTQIRIHPTQTDTIFAAAMGVPFERDTMRGLYRTYDGGQSWEQVLQVSDQAGIIDLVMDVSNPDRLFASSWDRIRNNQESLVSGPNAKIFLSEDGGDSWTQLEGGLPTDNQGRIGLTQSLSDPQTLYASYTGTNSQLFDIFKTTDGGVNWEPVLDPTSFNPISENALGGFGWYFGKIRVNPADKNDIYVLGVDLWRSRNGGIDWERAAPPWFEYSVHADKHDLQWDSQGRILLTTDGGMYRANAEVTEWEDMENIPCTQFYRVAVSPHLPGMVFGGAQDNGSTGGNSLEEEWPRIYGGDGFQMRFHPSNPQHYFAETQNGGINVTLNDGDSWFSATDGLSGDRRNWDMQYFMSPNDPSVMYTGTFRAFRAENSEFPFWEPISDDLTDGLILHPRYHSITCLDESPIEEGLLYVGTTDGNVWRGDNAGQSWTSITNGLPDRYVSSVKPSPDDPNVVYVTFSAFKDYDFTPLVFRSLDRGESWTSIAGDLPNLSINDIFIYPGRADSILFVANEGGVYGTINAGESWERLGQNMPLVQVRDLEIDTSTNELVAGSFARSILTYPLDSLVNPAVAEPPVNTQNNRYLAAELLLSPNPSNGPLQLSWQGLKTGEAQVRVLDLQGRSVWKQELTIVAKNGQQTLTLGDRELMAGSYLVEVRQGGKRQLLRWVRQ